MALDPAAVRPIRFCELTVGGELWPVYGWTIATSAGTILVDTGMVESAPEVDEEFGPVLLHEWPDLGDVVAVVNTHLHFDHCGGNRRFAGAPTYVQRAELDAAVEPDYLVAWARFEGESYVQLEGDAELFEDVSVVFTPGHSVGHQVIVVDTTDGLVVLGGDVTHSMDELIAGGKTPVDRVHALRPALVYLAHHERPWRPSWDDR